MIAGFTAWLPQSGCLPTDRSGQGIRRTGLWSAFSHFFEQHSHISLISFLINFWSAFSYFFDQHYNISLISALINLWSVFSFIFDQYFHISLISIIVILWSAFSHFFAAGCHSFKFPIPNLELSSCREKVLRPLVIRFTLCDIILASFWSATIKFWLYLIKDIILASYWSAVLTSFNHQHNFCLLWSAPIGF